MLAEEGFVAGIGGNGVFKIKENSDFSLVLPPDPSSPSGTAPTTFSFDAIRDSSYGGYLSLGYLTGIGAEGSVELGYRSVKFKNKSLKGNTIEVKNMTGLLVASYYLGGGNFVIFPYIKAGIGLDRAEVDMNLSIDNPIKASVKISNMKKWIIAYKAGAGIGGVVGDNMILGVGYEFFRAGDLKDSYTYKDVQMITEFPPANPSTTKSDINGSIPFGKITQITHNVEAFLKIVVE